MKKESKSNKKDYRFHSPTKQKVLLLLAAGIALGLTYSASRQLRLIKTVRKEWHSIDRYYLASVIREFKQKRLISYHDHPDGSTTITLTEYGQRYSLTAQLDTLSIPSQSRWDKRWRVVFFDIPEKLRAGRDALRNKLREFGFREIQKSVWIYPYPCKDQIDFVVEVFELRNYVRYGELVSFTLQEEYIGYFNLS